MTTAVAPTPPTSPGVTEPTAPPPPRSSLARAGRHAGIYGLGVILQRAVGFLMLPVYTHYLSPADYGVMELIAMTLNLISIVAGAKIALGIFRYYHKAETERERDAVVSTALLGLAVSYGVIGLGAALAAVPLSTLVFDSPVHAGLIRIAAAGLALDALTIVPLAYLRVQERPMLYISATLGRLVIGLALNIVFLVGLGMGVRGVLLSALIANVTVGIALAAYVVRRVGLHLSRPATRNLLRYGVPLIGTQLATFAVMFGDRYFLQAAASTTAVGLYSLAYNFGYLLAMLGYGPFEMVWEPMRFSVAKRADRDEMFARVLRYISVLLLSLGVAFALFAHDVLRVMTGPEFHAAAALVPPILLVFVLQAWTNLTDIGIQVRERTEYITLANWIAAGVALGGYAVLIPRYEGFGAAAATVLAFAVRLAIVYFVSQRLMPVRYRWAPVIRLVIWALAITAVGFFLPRDSFWLSVASRLGLLGCFTVGVWHLRVLEDSERAFVRRAIGNPRAALAALRA